MGRQPYFDNRIVPTVIKGNPNRHSWDNPGTVDDLNSTSVPTPGSTPHPHFIGGVFDKFLEKPQFTHRSRPLPMNQDSPETSPTTPRHVSEVVSTVKGPISSIMRSSPEPVETQTRTEFTNGVDGGSYEEIEEEVYEQGPVPAPGQFDPRYWASYMARIRDQIRETNLQRELDRRPSPPQSYVEFLQNRAQATLSHYDGPEVKPAVGPNPTLEQIARLFQQLKYITPRSILHDPNDRIAFDIGDPNAALNITAVANDCRDRYLRDRTTLIKALGHLLEVEKLVRLPLGRRQWEDFDLDNAKMRHEWRSQCRKHIDEVMVALKKVELQMSQCVYAGNWETGWTDHGPFPTGRRGMEIGNREKLFSEHAE